MKFCRPRVALMLLALPLLMEVVQAQGTLTPPGPPGPTMRTLTQIEPRTPISTLPFTISSAGAYYLTTNLTGVAGSHGITINSSDVTVDLNGFALSGVADSLNGIHLSTDRGNLSVQNGSITGWAIGIDARAGSNGRFELLRTFANRAQGLAAGLRSTIVGCNSFGNQGVGISTDSSSSVVDCSARANLDGIFAESESRIAGCIASHNTRNGLVLGNNCAVNDCLAGNNTASGVMCGTDAQVSGTKASNNGSHGISAGAESALHRCTASGNLGNGINAAGGTQVLECKAAANSKGIVVLSGSTVRGCSAFQNSGDGISVTSECVVLGNHAAGNFLARDAAGVHATGTDNAIQENRVISNDWGIRVEAAGNLIMKNSAANNSLNYFITGTQALGPIVTGTPTELTYPSANFEF
jgi:parallel beta-helix repeat protein